MDKVRRFFTPPRRNNTPESHITTIEPTLTENDSKMSEVLEFNLSHVRYLAPFHYDQATSIHLTSKNVKIHNDAFKFSEYPNLEEVVVEVPVALENAQQREMAIKSSELLSKANNTKPTATPQFLSIPINQKEADLVNVYKADLVNVYKDAFKGRQHIHRHVKIVISKKSVIHIHAGAFANFGELDLTLIAKNVELDEGAFENCYMNAITLNVPLNSLKIAQGAFNKCEIEQFTLNNEKVELPSPWSGYQLETEVARRAVI